VKAGPPNNPPQDARLDENDPVWCLLARAPRPEPEAWFAARTLARCRREGLGAEARVNLSTRLAGLGRMWRWALCGGLALSMSVALVATQIHSHKAHKQQRKVQEAFAIMASIDTDSDTSSSPWQDSSL
jgi:hypothetical protein